MGGWQGAVYLSERDCSAEQRRHRGKGGVGEEAGVSVCKWSRTCLPWQLPSRPQHLLHPCAPALPRAGDRGGARAWPVTPAAARAGGGGGGGGARGCAPRAWTGGRRCRQQGARAAGVRSTAVGRPGRHTFTATCDLPPAITTAVGYRGAGTVEFILDCSLSLSFLLRTTPHRCLAVGYRGAGTVEFMVPALLFLLLTHLDSAYLFCFCGSGLPRRGDRGVHPGLRRAAGRRRRRRLLLLRDEHAPAGERCLPCVMLVQWRQSRAPGELENEPTPAGERACVLSVGRGWVARSRGSSTRPPPPIPDGACAGAARCESTDWPAPTWR